jgi:hypothetical protein
LPLSAQEASPQLEECADFAGTNSLSASIESDLDSTAQSASIAFSVSLQNTGPQKIEGFSVHAHILPEEERFLGAGTYLLADNLSLEVGETEVVPFVWKVPTEQQPGKYEVQIVTTLSNGVHGVMSQGHSFTVVGEEVGSIAFAQALLIDGQVSPLGAPVLVQTANIPITAIIENTRKLDEITTVTWNLYRGGGYDEENLIHSQTETVVARAGERTPVRYVPSLAPATSRNYLTITATHRDEVVSEAGTILVQGDLATPHILAVGSTHDGRAYACFGSLAGTFTKDTRLVLRTVPVGLGVLSRLLGGGKKVSYAGELPRGEHALTLPMAKVGIGFNIVAEVYQGDKLIDAVSASHSCGGACRYMSLLVFVLILLAAVVGGAITHRRFKKDSTSSL